MRQLPFRPNASFRAFRLILSLLLVAWAAMIHRAARADSPLPATPQSNVVYVRLPAGEPVRSGRMSGRVRSLIDQKLKATRPAPDAIVFLVDENGRPSLPDLESARALGGARARAAAAANELTFTFHSPSEPWSAAERAALTGILNSCYPIAKTIYGPPAYSIAVNIRKMSFSGFAGSYNPSANEIGIVDLDPGVLCHEMLHAFRDDDLILLPTFEEGHVRAGEVELMGRLPGYPYFNPNHEFYLDVGYELENRPNVGAIMASLNPMNLLLRYNLAGYAWAKVTIENPRFLPEFNAELHRRTLSDPETRSDEAKLLAIAAAIQPTVEGRRFVAWHGIQPILDATPQTGSVLYLNPQTFPAYVTFAERPFGWQEIPHTGAPVDWTVTDHTGAPLGGGRSTIDAFGTAELFHPFPPGYSGRLEYRASARTAAGAASDRAWRYIGDISGIYGIVVGADTGVLTIRSLDAPGGEATVTVANGAFHTPSWLAPARGRFEAVFQASDSRVFTRQFTKDAAPYLLLLRSGGDLDVDGRVDCTDAATLRAAFGGRCGQAAYSAMADVNGDCVVDVRDMAALARHLPAGTACR